MKTSAVNKILLMFAMMFIALSLSAAEVAPPEDAQGDSAVKTVYILPWNNDPVIVKAGQVARIRFGWAACSKGLVQDFVTSARGTYILKKGGAKIQSLKMTPSKWGGYKKTNWSTDDCIWPAPQMWSKNYVSPTLKLNSPGTYKLRVKMWLSIPVIDGWDANGKWPIDYYSGVFIPWKTITITKK